MSVREAFQQLRQLRRAGVLLRVEDGGINYKGSAISEIIENPDKRGHYYIKTIDGRQYQNVSGKEQL